jgi:heat shock protein HslJ
MHMTHILKKVFLVLVVLSMVLAPIVYFFIRNIPLAEENAPLPEVQSLGDTAPIEKLEENLNEGVPAPTIDMLAWEFVRSEYDGTVIVPKNSGVFALTFKPDGTVQIATDCNSMSAPYTTQGYSLTFGPITSTKMYCEGSQETEFAKVLSDVHAYSFAENGDLLLRFAKSGVATFMQIQPGSLIKTPEIPDALSDPSSTACFTGGCSGEICSDRDDVVSTCIWQEEFACYQKSVCERQATGKCGWTETAELRACINASTHMNDVQVQ